MSDEFDAYRKWLGIPPDEQPAHYYRLLGIALFEDDPDVIENAANRQMAHVRTYQSGRHAGLSQQILNQLASAKICLLDTKSKRAYDAGLRQQLPPEPPLAEPPIAASPPIDPAAEIEPRPRIEPGPQIEPAPPLSVTPVGVEGSHEDDHVPVVTPARPVASNEEMPLGTAAPRPLNRSTRVVTRRRRTKSSNAGIVAATITIIAIGVILLFYIVSMLAN